MPCAECGSVLVIVEDSLTCPSCENIGLVPQPDSIRILQSILNERRRSLMHKAAAYDPDSILDRAFALREEAARGFILHYTVLDLEALIGGTAIIRALLQDPCPPAGRPASSGEAKRLIKSFATLLGAYDGLDSLRAGTYNMIHMGRYDLNNLRGLRASDFPLYPNEKHAPIMDTFARHGVVPKAEAARKIREAHSVETVKLGSGRLTSPEHAISIFYHPISMLSVALAANRHRRELFSVPSGASALPTFLELRRFIGDVPAFHDGVTRCHASHFERVAMSRFGARYAAFACNLVAGRNNPGAFPLCLKIKDEALISHFFSDLYFYTLLPILHKKEFDLEAARRGHAYERTVQVHFEQRGFRYAPNVTKKGVLEIDGIAVSEEIAYVIEAKCWVPRLLIGDPAYLGNLAQRMRGAIDGVQHERRTGKAKQRGVPLSRKVEWVREHRKQFGIGEGVEVKGLLAVNTVPPIQEYNGCEIVLVDDFEPG